MACAGAGAIAGTLLAALLGNFPNMSFTTLATTGTLGVLIVAFALSRSSWLSYLLLVAVGGGLARASSGFASLVHCSCPMTCAGG